MRRWQQTEDLFRSALCSELLLQPEVFLRDFLSYHSFNQYLLNTYHVEGSDEGPETMRMNKMEHSVLLSKIRSTKKIFIISYGFSQNSPIWVIGN